jgi:hypothetical protein
MEKSFKDREVMKTLKPEKGKEIKDLEMKLNDKKLTVEDLFKFIIKYI